MKLNMKTFQGRVNMLRNIRFKFVRSKAPMDFVGLVTEESKMAGDPSPET